MRWIIRALGALLALALLAGGALFLIPEDRIARLVENQVESATGRALAITGGIGPSLYPALGISTGPVTFANAEWSDGGPLLVAEGLVVGVDTMALIRGDIVLRQVELRAPRLLLERSADGRVNWDFGIQPADGPTDEEAPGTSVALPALDNAMIVDGALRFVDHGTGQTLELSALNGRAALPDPAGPAEFLIQAQAGDLPLSLELRVERLADLMSGAPAPLSVAAAAGGLSLQAEGRAGVAPVALDAAILARAEDLGTDLGRVSALASGAAGGANALPEGLQGPARLSARLTLTPEGSIHLRDGSLTLAGLTIGQAAADLLPGTGDGPASAVLAGDVNDMRLEARAALAAPEAFARGGESALGVSVALNDASLRYDGAVAQMGQFAQGALAVQLPDWAGLLQQAGLDPATIPDALRDALARDLALAGMLAWDGAEARLSLDRAEARILAAAPLTAAGASVRLPSDGGRFDVALTGTLGAHDLRLEGHVDRLSELAAGTGLGLRGALGENNIRFDGRAAMASQAVEGQINLRLADMPALAAAAGQPMPDLPDLVRPAPVLRGNFAWAGAEGRLELDDVTLGLIRRHNLSDLSGTLNWPARGGEMAAAFAGKFGELDLAVEGSIADVAALDTGTRFQADARLGAARVGFNGSVGLGPQQATGRFVLLGGDLPVILGMFGVSASGLPPRIRDNPVLRGQVEWSAATGTLRLSEGEGGVMRGAPIADLQADIVWPPGEGAGEARLSARIADTPLSLDARLANPAAAMAGRASPLTLKLAAAGTSLNLDGSATMAPPGVDATLDLRLRDLATLGRMAGADLADLPDEIGPEIGLGGRLRHTAGGPVRLDDARIAAGPNRLNGTVAVDPGGARPKITARLSGDRLDFSAFTGGEGSAAAPDSGWPRERIDTTPLQLVDADLRLNAAAIDLGVLQLDRTEASLRIDNGRARLTVPGARVHGGRLSVDLVADATAVLALSGEIDLNGISLRPLLRQTVGYDRLSGSASGRVQFRSNGVNVNQIMRRLNGFGNLRFGEGELLGFDLAGIIRNLDLGYMGPGRSTIYRSITASFSIRDGVLHNDDLRMDARGIDVDGSGTVNIGAQTLDYRVVPRALAGRVSEGGVSVPFLIRGPWSGPSFSLDLRGMAADAARAQREELERRAREEADRRLREVVPQGLPGGGALEDRLRGGVRDLLGR